MKTAFAASAVIAGLTAMLSGSPGLAFIASSAAVVYVAMELAGLVRVMRRTTGRKS